MNEPRWLTSVQVLSIHADQIRSHGGSVGLRDRGLLISALERVRSRHKYDPDADLASLAAAYGYGISSNHPFVDGNKRVAFQAMFVFLSLNGFRIEAAEEDVVAVILTLASSKLDEPSLAKWIRDHITPR